MHSSFSSTTQEYRTLPCIALRRRKKAIVIHSANSIVIKGEICHLPPLKKSTQHIREWSVRRRFAYLNERDSATPKRNHIQNTPFAMGMQAQHFQKACTVHAQDPPFPFPPSNKTGVRSRGGWSLGSYPSHRQTGFSVTDRYYHTQLEMSNNGYATKKTWIPASQTQISNKKRLMLAMILSA